MSKETEKIFRELEKFMKSKGLDEKDWDQESVDQFTELYGEGMLGEETVEDEAYDLLNQANEAVSERQAKILAKKALKLVPGLVDAEIFLLGFEEDAEKVKVKLTDIIQAEAERLQKLGIHTKENVGKYYSIFETRPYIRARYMLADVLIELGKYRLALKEYQEIYRLNAKDNLGVRYRLLSLYAFFEEMKAAERLYKKCKESAVHTLFPMLCLYYKADQYEKAKEILEQLIEKNEYFAKILVKQEEVMDDDFIEFDEDDGYPPGSVEELIFSIKEMGFLLISSEAVIPWCFQQLNSMKGKRRAKAKAATQAKTDTKPNLRLVQRKE